MAWEANRRATLVRLALRLYDPTNAGARVIVYLHGGMWMLGDLETHDRTCRLLADATSARVLAVDFRRAPEHPWPAAVEDALAEALRAARVPVMHRCEPGMVHGFIQNLDLVSPAAARATARFHRDARALLN